MESTQSRRWLLAKMGTLAIAFVDRPELTALVWMMGESRENVRGHRPVVPPMAASTSNRRRKLTIRFLHREKQCSGCGEPSQVITCLLVLMNFEGGFERR